MYQIFPPKVTKCSVVGLGRRYYRDSPPEQTIISNKQSLSKGLMSPQAPDVRPRPTFEFGLGALGLQGSTYRRLPIATFGGAWVRPGAPLAPAGPWGLGGWGGVRGPWVGSRERPGRCWDGAARRPALLAPAPHSFVLARGSWRGRGGLRRPLGGGRVSGRRGPERWGFSGARGEQQRRRAERVGTGRGLPPGPRRREHLCSGGFIVFRSRALLDS